MTHIGFLDGLRGLSILLVVAYHAWNITWLPQGPLEFLTTAGYYGVPMFFFISGFCLFLPYARDRAPTLRAFIVKRVSKILPSYYLALIVCWWLTPNWTDFKDLIRHALCVHNLNVYSMFSITSVFWSLGVEVQFYVLFPLLAAALIRWPWQVTPILIGASIGYRNWCVAHHPDVFYYDQLPGFLDCFLWGCLASLVLVRHPVRGRLPATLLALLGTAVAVGYLRWLFEQRFDEHGPMRAHVWGRTIFAAGLFLLTQGAGRALLFNWVLNGRPLRFFSRISYNLYLWHLFIMDWVLRHHLPFAVPDPHESRAYQVQFYLVTIGVATLWAWFLTGCYEQPLLRRINSALLPRRREEPGERS